MAHFKGARTTANNADASWAIVSGCTAVSPGCDNCVSRITVHRLSLASHTGDRYAGLTVLDDAGFRWSGQVRCHHEVLEHPLHWQKPRRVLVAGLGDLFHPDVPELFVLDVFRVMFQARQHTYTVFTKYVERMVKFSRRICRNPRKSDLYLATEGGRPWLPWAKHVHMGVSVEDQQRADERVPRLIAADVAVRVVAVEPMLGPVDLSPWLVRDRCPPDVVWREFRPKPRVNGVVVGGENSPKGRPMDLAWARALRDQCKANGVPFWMKSIGTRATDNGNVLPYTGNPRSKLSDLPIDLRVRQMPRR